MLSPLLTVRITASFIDKHKMFRNIIICYLSFLVYLTKYQVYLWFIPIMGAVFCVETVQLELMFVNLTYFIRKIRSLFQTKVIEKCKKLDEFLHNQNTKKNRTRSKGSKKTQNRSKKSKNIFFQNQAKTVSKRQVFEVKTKNQKHKDFCNFILTHLSPSVEEQYFCDCRHCTSIEINDKCAKQKCYDCTESKLVCKDI